MQHSRPVHDLIRTQERDSSSCLYLSDVARYFFFEWPVDFNRGCAAVLLKPDNPGSEQQDENVSLSFKGPTRVRCDCVDR